MNRKIVPTEYFSTASELHIPVMIDPRVKYEHEEDGGSSYTIRLKPKPRPSSEK
jgi:hypothetical protein